MNNQSKEREIFTKLGRSLLRAVEAANVESWNKVVMDAVHTATGTVSFKSFAETTEGNIIDLRLPRPFPADTVRQLHEYSLKNKYTPWNKFTFTLTADHNFNIDFHWDQELDDEYQEYL